MLSLSFSIYLGLTIAMSFVHIRIGISMFLLYSILVPFLQFFSFGQNIFPFLIVIALVFNYDLKSLNYKPLFPFLILYGTQLLIIPFHSDVPFEVQLNRFRVDVMSTLFLPFAMINVMQRDRKAIKTFYSTLLIAIIIAVFYSLTLTLTRGLNPYMIAILPLSGDEFNESYAFAENGGRVFGRISGVFTHPMTNGLFLSLSIIFILSFLFDIKRPSRRFSVIILILILIVTIFCIGVRTAIGATAVGVITYILLEKKFKLALYSIVVGCILLLIIQQIPGMEGFILSIFDSNSSNVSGSSMEMRLSQLDGALNEIKRNPLFGKGYNWTQYYQSTRGNHPIMLAFESLIYIILCNNGLVGIVIWALMIYSYFLLIKRNFKEGHRNIMISLLVTYLTYSTITGEYGYMKYFLIFFSIMWVYGRKFHPKSSNNYRIKHNEKKSKSHRVVFTPISSYPRKR